MDSGPIRPMLKVSKYKNTLILMNTEYYSSIIKLNLGLSKNQFWHTKSFIHISLLYTF